MDCTPNPVRRPQKKALNRPEPDFRNTTFNAIQRAFGNSCKGEKESLETTWILEHDDMSARIGFVFIIVFIPSQFSGYRLHHLQPETYAVVDSNQRQGPNCGFVSGSLKLTGVYYRVFDWRSERHRDQ